MVMVGRVKVRVGRDYSINDGEGESNSIDTESM